LTHEISDAQKALFRVPVCLAGFREGFSNSLFLQGNAGDEMKFGVVVEKDEDGYYIASVPELPGCHTQARTLDQVMKRIKEAIQAYLEAEGAKDLGHTELVGVQFVEVHAE
jgi:predicted RNase H-like HicB family nuclease